MRYPGLSPAQRHSSGLPRCRAGEVYSLVTSDRSCVRLTRNRVEAADGVADLCLHCAASLRHCVARSASQFRIQASSPASPFFRTLFSRLSAMNETPNHALQRTAPRVTVAAILRPGVFPPSHLCPTSVAFFFAPPAQLPRHAPPSLSLGSLGVAMRYQKTIPL